MAGTHHEPKGLGRGLWGAPRHEQEGAACLPSAPNTQHEASGTRGGSGTAHSPRPSPLWPRGERRSHSGAEWGSWRVGIAAWGAPALFSREPELPAPMPTRCPPPPPHQAPGVQPRCPPPPASSPPSPGDRAPPGSGCRRRCRHQRRALRREEAEPQTQTTAPARAKCAKKCVFWGRGGGEALLTPAMFIFRAPNLPHSHGENAEGHQAARHTAAPRQLRGLGVKSSQKRAADAGPAAAGELEEAQGLPPLRLHPVPRRLTRNS